MSRRTKWMAVTLVVAAVLAIGVGATVASAAMGVSQRSGGMKQS